MRDNDMELKALDFAILGTFWSINTELFRLSRISRTKYGGSSLIVFVSAGRSSLWDRSSIFPSEWRNFKELRRKRIAVVRADGLLISSTPSPRNLMPMLRV